MPKVFPFQGVRYNAAQVLDISRVTAPPYDMIAPAEQEELYRRDPHNIVRLILGKEREDGHPVDRYLTAAEHYRRWRADGVLIQDPSPALYLYREDYSWGGRDFQRLGLIARVALDEFGAGAFAHESTMSGPKADRLRLLSACKTNFSQIFSLYSDPEGRVEGQLLEETKTAPIVSFDDGKGVVHRLWRMEDPESIALIQKEMRGKPFIIADGHHRYETALEFRRLMRLAPESFRDAYDSVMMCLVRIESPGLTILPFHRLLPAPGPERIMERLATAFEMEEQPLPIAREQYPEALRSFLSRRPEAGTTFGLYRGGTLTVLRLRKGYDIRRHLRPGTPSLVEELDVTILHQVIFQGLLGLDEQGLVQEGRIRFFSKPEEAAQEVEVGRGAAAFFLRPSRIDQVWRIATAGQRMPQKSTNFYPKLISGLVLNEL